MNTEDKNVEAASNQQRAKEGDDRHICLCFHVSKRKIENYCRREKPPVASLISECLSAGTGCGWCIPFLKKIHAQIKSESPVDIGMDMTTYAEARLQYQKEKKSKAQETEDQE